MWFMRSMRKSICECEERRVLFWEAMARKKVWANNSYLNLNRIIKSMRTLPKYKRSILFSAMEHPLRYNARLLRVQRKWIVINWLTGRIWMRSEGHLQKQDSY